MKRNISKNAIKAMAIAMAVSLGSSTALSGALNTVTVKADEVDIQAEASVDLSTKIKNPSGGASYVTDNTSTVVTNEGYLFKITSSSSWDSSSAEKSGTATLIGVVKKDEITSTLTSDKSNANKPFLGSLEGGKVKVFAGDDSSKAKGLTLTIDKIGDNTNALKTYTIKETNGLSETSSDKVINLSGLTLDDATTIQNNAFKGLTIDGDLNLSKSTTIGNNAFQDSKISGTLNLSGLTDLNAKTNLFKGATIGSLDLSKVTQLGNNAFDGATIKSNLDLKAVTTLSGKTDVFKNATIEGDLDLSTATDLGSALKGTDNSSAKGVTVTGSLITKASVTFSANSLDFVNIGTLDLSDDTVSGATSNGATFGTLTLPTNFTGGSSAFKDTTVSTLLDLSKVTGQIAADTFVGTTNDKLVIENVTLPTAGKIAKDAFKKATLKNVDYVVGASQAISLGSSVSSENTITNLKVSGTEISASAFENAKLPVNIDLSSVEKIGANAFANATANTGTERIIVNLPKYDDSWLTSPAKIEKNSFGEGSETTGKPFRIVLPQGKDGSKLKEYLDNKNVQVNSETQEVAVDANNRQYIYKFIVKNEPNGGTNGKVTLVGFETKAKGTVKPTEQAMLNTIGNGVVTLNGKKYDLTTIGDGKTALSNMPYDALVGATGRTVFSGSDSAEARGIENGGFNLTTNVTEIAPKAFRDNKEFSATEQLVFDKVTKVGSDAFRNANIRSLYLPVVETIDSKAFAGSSLQSVRLGNDLDPNKSTSFRTNIFDDCDRLNEVLTNKKSKSDIENAIKNSASRNVTLSIKEKDGYKDFNVSSSGNSSSSSSGSSSSSSSGGGYGGSYGGGYGGNGGASVGVASPEGSSSSNASASNSSNGTTTNPSFESKPLTKDVIKLPAFTGEAKSFSDVNDAHWAKPYIDRLSQAGILNGSNGNFNPNGQTKRADVTIMLVKLLGLQPEANGRFADVSPNAYYAPYVGTASTYGIVNGSNGMFNPEAVISRQDTMVMISQILEALNINTNTDKTALNAFSDASQISGYAVDKVANLVNSGIISGNNGKINPKAPVTRAEMATIMSKLYDVINK